MPDPSMKDFPFVCTGHLGEQSSSLGFNRPRNWRKLSEETEKTNTDVKVESKAQTGLRRVVRSSCPYSYISKTQVLLFA